MIEVQLRDLETVEKYLTDTPARAEKALRLAINAAAVFGARKGKQEIMRQLNFKAAYLGNPLDPNARLAVGKKARAGELEAVIRARHRPTSLARFSTSPVIFGPRKEPVRVAVKRGATKDLRRGFYIKLRRGKELSADNYNLGIALRLKPGEKVNNKNVNVTRKGRYAILYGPSVEQAFNTVSVDIADDVLAYAEREFLRQYVRLENDG